MEINSDEESGTANGSLPSTPHTEEYQDLIRHSTHKDPERIRIPPEEFNAYRCGCYKCCCGPFVNQSCGYPPKTIRAMVAFIFTFAVLGTTCFAIIYFAVTEKQEASLGLIGALIGELGVITTAYFSAKREGDKTQNG